MGGGGATIVKPRYQTIDDIPDSMVKTYSRRDPDNKIYQTRRWVNFKKRQILYTQPDGVPNYLRTPMARMTYYTIVASSIGLLCANMYMMFAPKPKK